MVKGAKLVKKEITDAMPLGSYKNGTANLKAIVIGRKNERYCATHDLPMFKKFPGI